MLSEKGCGTVVRKNKEGFTLVELLLAMTITSLVLIGLVALISYSTRSMRMTQARVALQNQAKDVVNHISAYVLESGAKVSWDDTNKLLTVRKEKVKHEGAPAAQVDSVEAYAYWMKTDSDGEAHIYFSEATTLDSAFDPKDDASTIDPSKLTADKTCLLADDVDDFKCELKKTLDGAENQVLHVQVKLKDTISEFDCEKDIMMRNQ